MLNAGRHFFLSPSGSTHVGPTHFTSARHKIRQSKPLTVLFRRSVNKLQNYLRARNGCKYDANFFNDRFSLYLSRVDFFIVFLSRRRKTNDTPVRLPHNELPAFVKYAGEKESTPCMIKFSRKIEPPRH